jgi:hypothetical protein
MRKTNLKGPWYAVQPYECAGRWVIATDPEGNDTVDESGDGGFEKETAHLIAAAPEMYAELEAAMNVFRFYQGHHAAKGHSEKEQTNKQYADRIAKVLAKARGEA